MATRGTTCTNILQLVQIYSLSRQTFLFIVQKSNLKWLRYCCNAKNDHQRHHLCPALKPVLVVLDPKCGTIIKISPFYKTFTASSNLRSVFSQDLWFICTHRRCHLYQHLKWVLVVLDPKCDTIIKISPFFLIFYLKLKFDVRFFLGPLVHIFCQNVPPEAPHVPAVKTSSGGFRPQVWHHYQDISLL